MVNPLDAVAWTIGATAILLAIAAVKLPYNSALGKVSEEAKSLRISLALGLGMTGFFLAVNGFFVMWSGTFAAHYTVMFGGVMTLGGLLVTAGSLALYLNVSLSALSYLAGVFGTYVAVVAYAVLDYGLTKTPDLAALGYLSAAGALWGSVLGVNSDNKMLRYLFAILAVLFAIAWLYQGFEFTLGHLDPN